MASVLDVHGYHGTSMQAAAAILRTGFRPSRRPYDWLGDGVYFWQDAPERAWEWATSRWGSEAAVLGSRLQMEDCLDLLDIHWAAPLAGAYRSLLDHLQRQHLDMPRQTAGAHRLDRAVINHVVRISGRPVRSVRAAFQEGSALYPGSYFFDRTHVQISIRDLALIRRSWLEVQA